MKLKTVVFFYTDVNRLHARVKMSKVNSKNKSPNKKSPPVCLNKHQDNKIQELTDAEKIKLKNMNGVVNGVVNERKSASKKQKGHVKKEQLNGNCSENLDSVMKEHFIPENDQISNEDEKKNHFRGDLEHLSNSKSHLNSNNITCSTSKTVDNQKDFKLCSKKTKHKLKEKEVLEDKDCVKKDITNLSSRNNVDSKHDTTTECDLTIKHDANTKKGDKITVEEDLTTTKKNSLITSDNIGSEKEKVTTSKNVGEIVHRKEEKSNRDDEKNECTDKNNDKTSLEEINKSKNNNEICDTSANLENLKIDDKNANSIENVKQPKLNIKYVQYESELQMPMIMKIIQKDLSEPYSIYTYRYFIHNWPNLCFLVRMHCYSLQAN